MDDICVGGTTSLQPINLSCDERAGLVDMTEYTCISENPQILVN